MNLDPGILCFTHCHKRMFCFTVPNHCPLDGCSLSQNIVPFRVPYPFIRASQYTCAVVIKCTVGTFLRDYTGTDDLHIGAISSKGVLFEFDNRGLIVATASESWDQSLIVYKETCNDRFADWDAMLLKMSKMSTWSQDRYDENHCNCYDFILMFLQNLNHGAITLHAKNKTEFIKTYISPIILPALKYVKLYREVRKHGIFISGLENEISVF